MNTIHSKDDVSSPDDGAIARIEHQMNLLLRRTETAMASRPAPERLVRSGYLLLARLETDGPLGIAALADATYVDVSTASRQIVPLERQGFVRRLSNPADGRGSLIEITQLGLDRLRSSREERHQVYLELLHDWPESDRAVFAEYLARFNEALLARVAAGNGSR